MACMVLASHRSKVDVMRMSLSFGRLCCQSPVGLLRSSFVFSLRLCVGSWVRCIPVEGRRPGGLRQLRIMLGVAGFTRHFRFPHRTEACRTDGGPCGQNAVAGVLVARSLSWVRMLLFLVSCRCVRHARCALACAQVGCRRR